MEIYLGEKISLSKTTLEQGTQLFHFSAKKISAREKLAKGSWGF
jgi:hypothetical protein